MGSGKHPTSARVVHGLILIEPLVLRLLVTDAQRRAGNFRSFQGQEDGLLRIGSFTICSEFSG